MIQKITHFSYEKKILNITYVLFWYVCILCCGIWSDIGMETYIENIYKSCICYLPLYAVRIIGGFQLKNLM